MKVQALIDALSMYDPASEVIISDEFDPSFFGDITDIDSELINGVERVYITILANDDEGTD